MTVHVQVITINEILALFDSGIEIIVLNIKSGESEIKTSKH